MIYICNLYFGTIAQLVKLILSSLACLRTQSKEGVPGMGALHLIALHA